MSVVEKETPCYMYGKEKACLLSDLHSPVHTSQSFSATLTGHCPILRRLSCLHERPRRDGQKRCQWLASRKTQKFGMGASWVGMSHLLGQNPLGFRLNEARRMSFSSSVFMLLSWFFLPPSSQCTSSSLKKMKFFPRLVTVMLPRST